MHRHVKQFPLLLGALLLTGCATMNSIAGGQSSNDQTAHAQAESAQGPCARNFSVSGSFISGKKYTTYEDFHGTSGKAALQDVSQYLASNGWNITNANSDLGLITATQTVLGGGGETVPLNVVIKKVGAHVVRVQGTFRTGFGMVTSSNGQRDTLCQIIASVSPRK